MSDVKTLRNTNYSASSAVRLPVERTFVYSPRRAWTYSHHPHIAAFKDRYYAQWSNGRHGEDEPGQRVLVASSADFTSWTKPHVLAEPETGPDGSEDILTAAGFHRHGRSITAYYGRYDRARAHTRLYAAESHDGHRWSAPHDLDMPVNPNHGPQTTPSGRLIIAGNYVFPFSDDQSGTAGWRWASLCDQCSGQQDNPWTFTAASQALHLPVALCEGSLREVDGVLRMALRSAGSSYDGRLWESESVDDGETWSLPTPTEFSDNNAKFHFGRLPNGIHYYVGNPDADQRDRPRLVLSLSDDGWNFDRHFVLADEPYRLLRPGLWKEGQYGYPHSIVHEGYLCVIVSRMKEAVEVLRVRLSGQSFWRRRRPVDG